MLGLIELVKLIGWLWLVLAIIYFVIAGYGSRAGWRDEEIMGWVKWGIVFVFLWMAFQILATTLERKQHMMVTMFFVAGWLGSALVAAVWAKES